MTTFSMHWQSPHLSLLVLHSVACTDEGFYICWTLPLAQGTSCNRISCNTVLMSLFLLFLLVRMQMGHSAFTTAANTPDTCFVTGVCSLFAGTVNQSLPV